jgi:uncharacterized protein involved in exopolysaccharide biosynthesis
MEMLRARMAEAEHSLALERRKRRESDFDLARSTSTIDASNRSMADLRVQLAGANEAQAMLARKLNEESERSRALEAQLAATRDQAATDYQEFLSNVSNFRASEASLNESLDRLRRRLTLLESDNDRLHRGLPVAVRDELAGQD